MAAVVLNGNANDKKEEEESSLILCLHCGAGS